MQQHRVTLKGQPGHQNDAHTCQYLDLTWRYISMLLIISGMSLDMFINTTMKTVVEQVDKCKIAL